MKYTIMLLAAVLFASACSPQEAPPPVVERAEEIQEETRLGSIMSAPISEMRFITLTTRSGETHNWLVHFEHIPELLRTVEMFHSLDDYTQVTSQSPGWFDNIMWDVPILTKGRQIDTLWAHPGAN